MKTFKFRIYPSKSQARLLSQQLETCRKVYNKCLEYKISEYTEKKRHVGEYDLNSKICEWRKTTDIWMANTGIAFLHDISARVDKAFKGFYRRIKIGEKAGFPRFKSENRYNSMTNPRFTYRYKNKKVRLSNQLGWVKIVQHREFTSPPTGYTIIRERSGDWFICMWFETEKTSNLVLNESKNIGIDMGCSNFAIYSNGTIEKNPKFFKLAEKEITKVQSKKDKKGILEHQKEKYAHTISKIYKKVSNRRIDFLHKLSNNIVKNYDLIFIEDLELKKMGEKSYKNIRKSLKDGSWGIFSRLLSYKAEDAGKILGKVNPAYTSQECSACGKIKEKPLSERFHECECGYSDDRDINAARNILRRGLASLAKA